jgi:hypothetical protein
MRVALAALVAGVGVGFLACAGSPAAPTGTSTSAATIDSVITTFRGAVTANVDPRDAPHYCNVTLGESRTERASSAP